jgi:hypothetical protein
MRVLFQRLVEYAWVLYAGCAIGAIIYIIRALTAHRERNLAMFTLEREAAGERVIQAWAMVVVFIAISAAIFVSMTLILPDLPFYNLAMSSPTATPRAGVEPLTPVAAATSTEDSLAPTESLALTSTLPATTVPNPVSSPTSGPNQPLASEATTTSTPEPAETPTPTEVSETAVSDEIQIRFGDFATLARYSLSATDITTSERLLLTLEWQALEGTSPMDYMVFTHLLSASGEVRLIAQHDGVPANGTRPTTSWIAGETIVDPHLMTFAAEHLDYVGPATISVGLYDPTTGRVPTATGGEKVTLPVTINVVPE